MGEDLLGIGVFARRSRLSQKALRLYDRQGLLVPAEVDPYSGYRRYRESQLADARLVAMLRRLDMPLAEARALLAAPGRERAGLLARWWAGAEERFAAQRELAVHLRIRLSGSEAYTMYEVRTRDVAEQVVLTEQRHMGPDELPQWLPAATERLLRAAEAYGGAVGPDFVVYHGEVSEDSDGPAEVCVPIAAENGVPDGVAARIEPAHREAYVRVTKAQVGYPQLLSAYDAVEQWIRGAEGVRTAGPCREVYFADFGAAAPGDEVCDVAFPVVSGPAPGA